MTDRELALRRQIFEAFARTGAPPPARDAETLRALAAQHVVVLDDDGEIVMAHPFAGHREGTRVDADGRTWWGNCAWDGLGIVAALGLRDATLTSNGLTLDVRDGEVAPERSGGGEDRTPVFHVAVPAREWWADIGFT
jgi:hypothetical protein